MNRDSEYFGFLLSSASKTGCIAKLMGASQKLLIFLKYCFGIFNGKPK